MRDIFPHSCHTYHTKKTLEPLRMLRFTEYTEIKNHIEGLLEANIHMPRYSEGDMVVLKDGKISDFNKRDEITSFTATKSTIFVRAAKILTKDDSDTVIEIGEGEPEVTLNVFDDMSKIKGTPSIVVTWRQSPDSFYNHLKSGDEINWGGSTSTLETAQCIGVFYDGNDDIDTPAGKEKVIEKITKVLNNGQDWHKNGKAFLLSKLPTMINKDWGILMELIQGMAQFKNEIVSPSPISKLNIIHGSIDKGYKKAESENTFTSVKVSGEKDNTSDMIICDSSAGGLTKAIRNEKVTHDPQGICTTDVSGINFVQVSLKKSEEGAQLGKGTSAILKKYKIDPVMDIWNEVIGEQYHPDYVQYLDEGFFDFFSNMWNKVKEISKSLANGFKKLITGAKKFFSGWIAGIKQIWKSESDNVINEYSKLFDLQPRDVKSLIESFNSFVEPSQTFLSEARKLSINTALKDAKDSDIIKLVSSINRRTTDLITLYDDPTQWYLDHKVDSAKIRPVPANKFNFDILIKLLSNEVSLRTLDKMFRANRGNIKLLVADMIDIQKEIYFGKTSLPLYKVYSLEDKKSKPYKYLYSAAEFSKEKEDQIGAAENTISFPISAFSMSSQKNVYYNIESWIITGVEEGRSTYAKMRMGTNRSGAFSYVIEGTKSRSQDDYEKKFK